MIDIVDIKGEIEQGKITAYVKDSVIYLRNDIGEIVKIGEVESKDVISRQAVLEIINDIRDCISVEGYCAIFERMKLPSINPQESKTGHWIYIRNSEVNGLKIVKCSECGKRTYGSGKYCPNCGAKMEVRDKE